MKRVYLLIVGCVLILLTGPGVAIASSDVGCVDYYRVQKGSGLQNLVLKYAQTKQQAILPGQPFSINMSTATAGKFKETFGKGEIAIIARVSERGAVNGGLQFGSNAADSGRLIYFSNDVKKQQSHNFSYIPVYGPLKYNGKPLDIQLYIFEVDDVEQFKPLLHSLTKAGQALYPPASPVLGLLDTLGSALLSAAKHDKMLEYTLCLWPQAPITKDDSGYQTGEFPVLEAGHYVFVRQQDRKAGSDSMVTDIKLNPGNHKLVRSKDDDGNPINQLYNDDSYIVLHIKRESFALTLDEENEYYKTFDAFKQAESESNTAYAKKVNDELASLASEFIRAKQRKDIYTLFEGVSGATRGQETYAKINSNKLLHQLQGQISKRNACTPDDEECGGAMKKEEIMEVLSLIRTTTAFTGQEAQLTYENLGGADIGAIVKSISESLPE